jgi:hypothetical protein
VPVHGGLAAVASREAHRDTDHRRCRAQELTVGGAKGGGHFGDPYRLHKRVVEGRRRGRRRSGASVIGRYEHGEVELGVG